MCPPKTSKATFSFQMQATPQIPAPGLVLYSTIPETVALAGPLARAQLCVLRAGWIVPNPHLEGTTVTGHYLCFTQRLIFKAESRVSIKSLFLRSTLPKAHYLR